MSNLIIKNKKYELTSEYMTYLSKKLYRIKALIDFSDVNAGELGGYIEKEDNLSHNGDAWVYSNTRVCSNTWVGGNAWVGENVRVECNAMVGGNAWVEGNAWIGGNALVSNNVDYLTIGPIGSSDDTVTFMRSGDNKIIVKCGCFTGDIDAFIAKVEKTHRDNENAKAYLLAAEIAKTITNIDNQY